MSRILLHQFFLQHCSHQNHSQSSSRGQQAHIPVSCATLQIRQRFLAAQPCIAGASSEAQTGEETRLGTLLCTLCCITLPFLFCRVKVELVYCAHVFCICSLPTIVGEAPDVGRYVRGDSNAFQGASSCL